MARHRSPRGPMTTLSGLAASIKPALARPLFGSGHGGSVRRLQRRPLAAVAATVAAAGIFVGSQPVSLDASAEARQVASAPAPSIDERSAQAGDAAVSRDDRQPSEPIVAPPPLIPGEDEVLTPELSESGSADGPNGAAALTGNPCPTAGFGGVEPHVAQAGYHLITVFGLSESDVGGVASRPGNPTSDHPRGLALDFMVDTSTGDALAAYAEDHSAELGISYILWQVPNHYGHVHISFNSRPGTGMTC